MTWLIAVDGSQPLLNRLDPAMRAKVLAALAALGLADVLSRLRPDMLLLIADRYEMLAPASVALALIEELERPGVYERLEEVGTRLQAGLRDAVARSGIDACVTGVPSVFEIWFCKDEPYDHRSAKASDFYKNIRFSDLLLQLGVLKAAEKFFVSAVHTDEDINRTVEAFHIALEQLAKEVE